MKLYLYASEMWRAINCPGSVKATRKPRESHAGGGTGEAQFGWELHKVAEEVIDGKLELEQVAEPERTYISRCLTFLKGRELAGETESPLFLLVGGELVASCRADLLSVNPGAGEVVIPDWKFYRAPLDPMEWQWQALTMQAAALQEHKDCHVAVAVAYLPVLDMTYEYRLDRELLEETTLQIYGTFLEANKPQPRLSPGPWCGRCGHLADCAAVSGAVEELAEGLDLAALRDLAPPPTVAVIKEKLYVEVEKWSRGRFLGYLQVLPVLRPLIEALTDRLRRELAQGIHHTDWELKDKRKPRVGTAHAVRTALRDFFTPTEFDAFLKPQFGKIKAALLEKGLTEEKVVEILEPFDEGTRKDLARRK